jgi:Ca2+-binding RTX toxin-like protein
MAGGDGNDAYTVDNAGDLVVEAADQGTDRVNASISYALGAHVENLVLTGTADIDGTGNALNNAITGNAGANTLSGGEGNDSLRGMGGADTLVGGIGNDTLDGGAGTDILVGGQGNDYYIIDDTDDVVVELSNQGTDMVQSAVSYALGAHVENLSLTGTGDIAGTGNSLANTIIGNSGANALAGGEGNDTLRGHGGNDSLTGDAGNDTFVFAAGYGVDTITDFAAGAAVGDRVNLTGIAALDDFGDVVGRMMEQDGDVRIDFSDLYGGVETVLIIENTTIASFHANDFIV